MPLEVLAARLGTEQQIANRAPMKGFPVTLSEQQFEFSIFPNGRMRLIDASGQHEGRIEDWEAM